MDFRNKVAVVTGASSGIGKIVARDLAALGCKVVIVGRDKEKLSKAKSEILTFDKDVLAISCDVSNRKHVEEMAKQIIEKKGKVNILINAAGFGKWRSFEESTVEEIEDMMKTNYLGTVYTTKAFLKSLREQEEAHIVNIASVAGFIGMPNFSAYCASKFAVIGLSESMHNEFYGSRLGITVVCPGAVKTHFFDDPSFTGNIPKNGIAPETVSKAIINALKTKQFFVVVPKKYKSVLFAKALLPKQVQKYAREHYRE
jgi:short-subunit dehydrogenase